VVLNLLDITIIWASQLANDAVSVPVNDIERFAGLKVSVLHLSHRQVWNVKRPLPNQMQQYPPVQLTMSPAAHKSTY
jgi:hypothetical protein